jgi:hypothetical protein
MALTRRFDMAGKKVAPKVKPGQPNEADGRVAISPSQLSPAGLARAQALAKQYDFTLKEPAESGIGPDAPWRTENKVKAKGAPKKKP